MGTLRVKRIYDPAAAADGKRILVDRLWPRGISKASSRLDLWLKDAAPSPQIREWFSHSSERWDEFKARYFAELVRHPEAWSPIVDALRGGDVTLLFAARDTARNNAAALAEFLLVEQPVKPSLAQRRP